MCTSRVTTQAARSPVSQGSSVSRGEQGRTAAGDATEPRVTEVVGSQSLVVERFHQATESSVLGPEALDARRAEVRSAGCDVSIARLSYERRRLAIRPRLAELDVLAGRHEIEPPGLRRVLVRDDPRDVCCSELEESAVHAALPEASRASKRSTGVKRRRRPPGCHEPFGAASLAPLVEAAPPHAAATKAAVIPAASGASCLRICRTCSCFLASFPGRIADSPSSQVKFHRHLGYTG
jgi:hypothetical protein